MMATTKAGIPEAFAGLLQPHRYKCFYGGRGSAKSWTFAPCLICRAAERPLRILCTREMMTSVRESVHQLLSDRIYALGQPFGHRWTDWDKREFGSSGGI